MSKFHPQHTTWTPEMDNYLRENLRKSTYEQIGRALGVSKNSVCGRVKRLGLCRTEVLSRRIHFDETRPSIAPISLAPIPRSRVLDPDT